MVIERPQSEEEDNCEGKRVNLVCLSRHNVKNNVKAKKMWQQVNIY